MREMQHGVRIHAKTQIRLARPVLQIVSRLCPARAKLEISYWPHSGRIQLSHAVS